MVLFTELGEGVGRVSNYSWSGDGRLGPAAACAQTVHLPACPTPAAPHQAADKTRTEAPLCRNWPRPQGLIPSGCLPRLACSLPLPGKVMAWAVFVAGSHGGSLACLPAPGHSHPLLLTLRQATNGGQSRHGQPDSLICEGQPLGSRGQYSPCP